MINVVNSALNNNRNEKNKDFTGTQILLRPTQPQISL